MPIRRYMMIRPFWIVPWKAHVAVRSFIPAIVSQPRAQSALSERTLEATGAGSARLTGGITSESSGDSRLGLFLAPARLTGFAAGSFLHACDAAVVAARRTRGIPTKRT